jgi:maltooligosyltrehalose trehalohydrolase
MKFQVWAPAAKQVGLHALGGRLPMRQTGGSGGDSGWWTAELPGAGPGTDYQFSIDGGPPRPDPRSPCQPLSVHGPSRTVDHGSFPWSDREFRPPSLADGVIYELHVGSFSREGTFEGAIRHLRELVDLGVTHVEVMPVAAAPGSRGWGYDGVGLYAPHQSYGGPDGFKRFIDACHGHRLAVLLDVVYNHLGPSGNYLGSFGPYFTERYATPWGQAVNLDGPHADEVRRFFIDNALMWVRDYHLDGLRLDAVHALLDTSALHFLEQLAGAVHDLGAELGRPVVVIAESDLNDPRLVRSEDAGGYGLDAMWADGLHHALHATVTGEGSGYYEDFQGIDRLAKALSRGMVYDGVYSAHRRRRHGRPLGEVSGRRLVSFLQNHDQVGNRARGERIGHLVGSDAIKVAATLLLTAPQIPLLFQGEEWGATAPFPYFTDHDEPALAEAVREGRRREFSAFGWKPEQIPDPQAEATFLSAKLDWSERQRAPHADVLAHYRALVRLRRERPELRDGRFDLVHVRFDERARWLLMARDTTVVAANFGSDPARIELPGHARGVLLSSRPDVGCEGPILSLPPVAAAVLA